jgi:hypothetical protein
MFAYVDIGVIVDHGEYVIMFVYVDIGVIVDHVEYVIMFADVDIGTNLFIFILIWGVIIFS